MDALTQHWSLVGLGLLAGVVACVALVARDLRRAARKKGGGDDGPWTDPGSGF